MNGCIFTCVNNVIRLVPEALEITAYLHMMTEKQLEWIVFVEDPIYSPYHMKPRSERKIIATRRAWPRYAEEDYDPEEQDSDNGKLFKKALEEYKGIVYCRKRERLRVIDKKLDELNDKILTAEKLTELKSINESIKYLEEMKEEVLSDIEKDEDDMSGIDLKGGGKLSLIEQMRRSQEMRTKDKKNEVTFES